MARPKRHTDVPRDGLRNLSGAKGAAGPSDPSPRAAWEVPLSGLVGQVTTLTVGGTGPKPGAHARARIDTYIP